MSKARVLKELKNYTADELVELIGDIYDAKVPAKVWLEYFLNPNEGAMLEKTREAIRKEIGKVKRGHMGFKISNIKKHLDLLESLGVDPREQLEMVAYAISAVSDYAVARIMTTAQINGMVNLLKRTLTKADKLMLLSEMLPRFISAFERERYRYHNIDYPRGMKTAIEDFEAQIR